MAAWIGAAPRSAGRSDAWIFRVPSRGKSMTTFGSCFYFYIYDSAGDGLLNGANWSLSDSQGRIVLEDNGAFIGQSPSMSPASRVPLAGLQH